MYDIIVIGAGIIGSCVARELSKYQVKTLVLEKENDVANVQTLANSAILHSGHNPEPGSLKAKLNILGNKMYDQMEKELDIAILRTGAYVIAHNEKEEKQLEELYENSKVNGVPEFYLLDYDEAKKEEPNLASSVTKVLSLPTTKVTYPWDVAFACMENAILNGVEFLKNSKVTSLKKVEDYFLVTVNKELTFKTKRIVNAAGVAADDISALIEKEVPYKVTPRKGEYFVLDKRVKGFVNHVLYPLPTELGKGVLLTPQVHGNILVGPNSLYVNDKYDTSTSYDGLEYVKANAPLLADNIPFHQIIRSFAGIRATINKEDFYIKESAEVKHFYHLAGIDSPGLTAAPAIAKYLVEDVMKIDTVFNPNTNFNPIRNKLPEFYSLPKEERDKLIKKYPTYGNIICKCEKITEKEVVDAINGPLGSDTIKGVKKRVRTGAGLCQGGYCEEKVMKLIVREKHVSPLDVKYDSNESNLFVSETKVKK